MSITIKSRLSSKFSQIESSTVELAALEHLEKSPKTYNGRNVVATLVSNSFLIGSSSFLQVIRTTIKTWMTSKFDQLRLCNAELPALERLKKISIDLLKWEKCCGHSRNFIFHWIFFLLVGNKDMLEFVRILVRYHH